MDLPKKSYIKKYIKLILAYPTYRKIFKKLQNKDGKRAIFIGSPIHSNLGDHLIAIESLKYINSFKFDEIIEIPEFVYELFRNKVIVKEKDIIFISGGRLDGRLI